MKQVIVHCGAERGSTIGLQQIARVLTGERDVRSNYNRYDGGVVAI
jgi:hypothetical protein